MLSHHQLLRVLSSAIHHRGKINEQLGSGVTLAGDGELHIGILLWRSREEVDPRHVLIFQVVPIQLESEYEIGDELI